MQYNASIDYAIVKMNDKIQRDSLKFLGFEMNNDLLTKASYALFAIISGIME